MAAPVAVTSSSSATTLTSSTMSKDIALSAKASSIGTPLSASFPSELRSPMLHSPRFGHQTHIKQENGALKTPITPPSAYLDFLKQLSPSMQSPLCTSASASGTFSFSKPSPLGTNFGGRTPSSATFTRPLSATYPRQLSASMVRPPLSSNPSTNSSTSNASAATCASATSAASNIGSCSTPTTNASTTPTFHRRKSSTTIDTTTRTSTTTTTTTESTTTSVTGDPCVTPTSAAVTPSDTAPSSATNSSKPIARPLSSTQTYPYPSQRPSRSSTSSSGVLRPTLRIPQSPMYTPALMRSPGSASSSLASTNTPQSMSVSSPVDWEAQAAERKKGTVHVRQVVTRTITYCRTPVTPLEPAPKGKRRKLLHEPEGADLEAEAERKSDSGASQQ